MCRLALNVAVVLALITSLTRPDAAQANGARYRNTQHSGQWPAGLLLPLGTVDLRGKLRSCAPIFGGRRTTIIEIRPVSIITAASECTGCDVCYWHLADIILRCTCPLMTQSGHRPHLQSDSLSH